MAKVIVECEGKRHEFEGAYVIGFAIDALDEEHVAVDGMHYGWGRSPNWFSSNAGYCIWWWTR